MDHITKTTKRKILITIFFMMIVLKGAAPALASDSVVMGDYQIQILTDPEPLIANKEVTLTIKILRTKDYSPVRGGEVFLSTDVRLEDIRAGRRNFSDIKQLKEAKEIDKFGNYELKTTFPDPTVYYVKVVIKNLDVKNTEGPLSAGFSVSVNPPDKSNSRLLFILMVLLATTIAGTYIIYVRRNTISGDSEGLNLLDIPWIKHLLQWKYIQPVFQVPMLIFLVILVILALTDIQDAGRNVSTILIWTIWWAGIIFTFVLVGRLWCFTCPVGAITEWTSRIFRPNRLFPAKLRNVWLANLMFVLLTWLDIQLGVVRNPMVTGSLLIGITAIAIIVGLLFQRRSFCRYLCPIGGLIGIYSMFSAVSLRSKDFEVCRSHKRKDCYLGNERGYGCPMFEMLPTMDSNNLCTFCGECVKSCPKNNITLRIRPFFRDAWTTKKRYLDEATLAIVLVGISIFVTGDMLEPWGGWMKAAMTLIPADKLGIEYEYTKEIITKSILFVSVSLLLIPGLMLLTAAVSNRMVGKENHNGLKQTFITFGYMFIPIGLSMHLAHNLGHLLKESGTIVPAIQRVINTYTPFFVGNPNWRLAAVPLVDTTVLYWMQMGLFLVFYVYTLYAGYRLALNNYKDRHTAVNALLPMILFSCALMLVNVYLLNLPMAPRHVH